MTWRRWMYCWVGKRVTEETKEFRSCSAQRLAAVFRVSQATCRVAAETEASGVEEAFDNETCLEPPKAVLSSQYLVEVDELSSNDICVRPGEVRLGKTQVDLLYSYAGLRQGRVHAASGAPPCWAGRIARSVTNRILYLYAVPHTTASEQEQLCAGLESPCVTLIRFVL